MATTDKIVDQVQNPNEVMADPNVVMPRHVQEAKERAEAFYAQPEQTPEQLAAAEEAARATATHTSDPPNADAQAAEAAARAAAPQHTDTPIPSKQELQDDTWAGRYNSMRGRYDRAMAQVGSMQEQLIQAGDEIGRLNALLARGGVDTNAQQQNNQPVHNNVITEQDRDTYGEELIDTMARVARGVVQPEIDQLKNENAELKKKTITNEQKDLRQKLQQSVPNWVAIQASDGWKNWLRLPNVYTGEIRGKMLKAAYDAADASKVIALFRDFETEVRATGGTVPTNQRQEQQVQPAPQREPAVALEQLAAPGRAKPASGNDPAGSAEKPIITRQFISDHYRKSRQGYYNGRQAEYNQNEAAIQAATREGRIQG